MEKPPHMRSVVDRNVVMRHTCTSNVVMRHTCTSNVVMRHTCTSNADYHSFITSPRASNLFDVYFFESRDFFAAVNKTYTTMQVTMLQLFHYYNINGSSFRRPDLDSEHAHLPTNTRLFSVRLTSQTPSSFFLISLCYKAPPGRIHKSCSSYLPQLTLYYPMHYFNFSCLLVLSTSGIPALNSATDMSHMACKHINI